MICPKCGIAVKFVKVDKDSIYYKCVNKQCADNGKIVIIKQQEKESVAK